MTAHELYQEICHKKSFLCVGLDTELKRIPAHLHDCPSPIYEFNKQIIQATAAYTVAYKPNLAFYEAEGIQGWQALEQTIAFIRQHYPKILIIADAKRGDIGNTSRLYAEAFFDKMQVDAVTLSPYMGRDTVQPFLEFPNKWAVLLALTSNPSASDFEQLNLEHGQKLYEQVLATSMQWGSIDNTMYVVGATQASVLKQIRQIVPHHFLLVPGVGAQGGSLDEVAQNGINAQCGLLVNASRSIIFAQGDTQFAEAAAHQAQSLQQQMAQYV
ncbi:MAG: orotidine-5'-phosphate decarboxylase [Bacteroidales bacterium]